MIRIGEIPYLNSVLFYDALKREPGLSFTPLVPRALSGAAGDGVIDAGPVPLVTCWDIEDRFDPLGDFCIATTGKARSILLFSDRSIAALEGATVAVTRQTSTSVRLMKALFAHYYRIRPARYVDAREAQGRPPGGDAVLLIGDDALRHRNGLDGFEHVVDLGEAWHAWTGLPFVFARWVVRRDLAATDKDALADVVGSSLEAGWRNFDTAVAAKADELGMRLPEIREYLEGFHFRMTPDEHEAVQRFRELDRSARELDATRQPR